jgi:hypothetical protein
LNVNGIWREAPFGSVDVGLKKKLADGRGTISVSGSDIFRTSFLNSTAKYGNIDFSNQGFGDSRRVRVSISWKLGRSEYEREQRRQSAADEKGRAQ